MSTLKKNITAHRLALLATKGELIFHSDDLANLWGIQNMNTLRVTLGRYVKNGLLHRIYRGFYALMPLNDLDPVLAGARALHQFCYLGTESILYNAGFISQKPQHITFISEKSLKFSVGENEYLSRQLNAKYLYQPNGIYKKDGVNISNYERAIADMLYFNPYTNFDKPIKWEKIKKLQKEIGYPLTHNRYDPAKP